MVLVVLRERLPRLTGRCLAPDGLNSRAPMLTCPPRRGETSATIYGSWFPTRHPITPRTSGDGPHMTVSPVPCDHETEDTMPALRKRRERGRPSSHVPIRPERPTTDSYALPPGRNETVRPQDRTRSRPLRLDGLICCRPLSHRLTQRQYHSPPVRPQSPQSSPGPRRQH